MTYNADNYRQQGGDNWVVGGTLTIASGGQLIDTDGKWLDLTFPASGIQSPGTKPPGEAVWIGGIKVKAFDAATQEEVHVQAQLNHNWKAGTSVTPHVHWATSAGSTTKVRWGLEYSIADINGNWSAATTDYVLADPTTQHGLKAFTAIDMSAYSGPSTMILFRLFRDSTAATDTYAADAYLMEFDVHYKAHTLGTSSVSG